jgi:hypothetical protein
MGLGSMSGQTGLSMKANGRKMKSQAMATTSGQMAGSM